LPNISAVQTHHQHNHSVSAPQTEQAPRRIIMNNSVSSP